ncbi:DEKNAAC102500 [Brettanomyces naardenensis]|uniref:DEKNAAC102500 n=1 Tax=Brettanomyces naardenensis TaxID=13370 RepID=A0A448YKM2_BRENA|nr:DEKNAAC102500 [Brettanomyces naardenensis]
MPKALLKAAKVVKVEQRKGLSSILRSRNLKHHVVVNGKKCAYSERNYTTSCKTMGSHGIRLISGKFRQLLERQDKESGNYRIAAFDLDDTIVQTKTGSRFSRSSTDWKFKYPSLQDRLSDFSATEDNSTIPIVAIFTNQGGVTNKEGAKSLSNLIDRLNRILEALPSSLPIVFYGATKKAKNDTFQVSDDVVHSWFRKPNVGMFEQLIRDLEIDKAKIDYKESFYCGDAAGRKGDFSDSDLQFAKNIEFKFFTPEEYFE